MLAALAFPGADLGGVLCGVEPVKLHCHLGVQMLEEVIDPWPSFARHRLTERVGGADRTISRDPAQSRGLELVARTTVLRVHNDGQQAGAFQRAQQVTDHTLGVGNV